MIQVVLFLQMDIDCGFLQRIRHLFCKVKIANRRVIKIVKGPHWMVVKSLFKMLLFSFMVGRFAESNQISKLIVRNTLN